MKIVTEEWTDDSMTESGYHVEPPMYVIRFRKKGRRPQVIQVESVEELLAVYDAVLKLVMDRRKPADFEPGFEKLTTKDVQDRVQYC